MADTHTYEDADALVPIGKASALLGVNISTVRRWEEKGYLRALRTPGGQRRFRQADLDALLKTAS